MEFGKPLGKKTDERFRWVLEGEMARLRLGFPVDVSTYDIIYIYSLLSLDKVLNQ